MKIPRLFLIACQKFFSLPYPEHLKIQGREKLPNSAYAKDDLLYRSFKKGDLDTHKHLKLETIKFPDVSCNWNKFSVPEDVWHREKGTVTDGCYAFSVEDSRYNNIAAPVHDPIFATDAHTKENYSHTEVRVLRDGQHYLDEIPRAQELRSKTKKLAYRQHIQEVCKILIKAY